MKRIFVLKKSYMTDVKRINVGYFYGFLKIVKFSLGYFPNKDIPSLVSALRS